MSIRIIGDINGNHGLPQQISHWKPQADPRRAQDLAIDDGHWILPNLWIRYNDVAATSMIVNYEIIQVYPSISPYDPLCLIVKHGYELL